MKCLNGWDDGSCCCNCEFQKKVNKHPKNSEPFKGSISEPLGYVCTVSIGASSGEFIFFDTKHGMCELHVKKEDL